MAVEYAPLVMLVAGVAAGRVNTFGRSLAVRSTGSCPNSEGTSGGTVTYSQLHLSLIYLLLVVAAVSDATTRRVPNAIPVLIAASGIVASLAAGGVRAALLGAAGAVAVMALLIFPWSRRMIGGGDVKLAVACAAWVGLARFHVFVLATAIAGGIVSCAALAAASCGTAEANPAGSATWRERARAIRVPYAIAIGAGALVAIHWRSP